MCQCNPLHVFVSAISVSHPSPYCVPRNTSVLFWNVLAFDAFFFLFLLFHSTFAGFFSTSVVFYSTYVVFCVLFRHFVAVHLTSQGHHRKFNSQDFISHLLTMKYMWVDIKRHLEMGELTM